MIQYFFNFLLSFFFFKNEGDKIKTLCKKRPLLNSVCSRGVLCAPILHVQPKWREILILDMLVRHYMFQSTSNIQTIHSSLFEASKYKIASQIK